MMCADLLNLEKSVRELENAGVDYLHIDIMDGAFVPNIAMGFDAVNALKRITDIPLDVHMMVNDPSRFTDRMNLTQDDILCVHFESDVHIGRTLSEIKKKGIKAGLALNPHTPIENIRYLTENIDMLLVMTVNPGFAGQKIFSGAFAKTADAREFLDGAGRRDIPIEVDGNISAENGRKLFASGAEIFVLGTSSLFGKDTDIKTALNEFRKAL